MKTVTNAFQGPTRPVHAKATPPFKQKNLEIIVQHSIFGFKGTVFFLLNYTPNIFIISCYCVTWVISTLCVFYNELQY